MEEYKCPVCGMIYDRQAMVDACKESHETVYIKLTRFELFELVRFILSEGKSDMDDELITKLMQYKKGYYV